MVVMSVVYARDRVSRRASRWTAARGPRLLAAGLAALIAADLVLAKRADAPVRLPAPHCGGCTWD